MRATTSQLEAIRSVVAGRRVHDLGAGDCSLSVMLLELGATHVTAIDKHPIERVHPPVAKRMGTGQLKFEQTSFEQLEQTDVAIDVAFVSWPNNYNYDTALANLAQRAQTVVYLGSNYDYCACGGPHFFEQMVRRKLLAHVPDKQQTLIIVGEGLPNRRAPVGEEIAGILSWQDGGVMSYKDTLLFSEMILKGPTTDGERSMGMMTSALPSSRVVSSIRITEGSAHDRVKIWSRGGLAGELTLSHGDGLLLAALLRLR